MYSIFYSIFFLKDNLSHYWLRVSNESIDIFIAHFTML